MNDALLALDPSARTLRSDGLRAVFLPGRGMLGAMRYRTAGKEVLLNTVTSIGHDDKGLPMHGVPWPRLAWQVMDEDDSSLNARLDWTSDERLAVFPFPHRVEMSIALGLDTLSIETTLRVHQSSAVPVSFGLHPYFRLSGLPRAEWQIHSPAMSRLLLDGRSIPTGEETPVPALDAKLGDRTFDDGFALLDPHAFFSIGGNGRRITVEFAEGYRYAQVFAPRDLPRESSRNAMIGEHHPARGIGEKHD